MLAVLYVGEQRRRRAAAAAFAAPALQPSVAPRRPRWRRHAPMAAVALALALLVVAAAKPQRTVAVPVERASVMLATDVSGSMTATDVQPSRLVAAKRAARRFVDEVPDRVNVGLVAFNSTPRVLQSPTRDREVVEGGDRQHGVERRHGHRRGDRDRHLARCDRTDGAGERRPPAAILLLSDGKSTSGRDAVAAAPRRREARGPVYTVVLGTDAGHDHRPAGRRRHAPPARPARSPSRWPRSPGRPAARPTPPRPRRGLKEIYESLGSQLGHENQKREITSAVTGGGLVLMLVGVAMSLRWFGRLI